MTEIEAICAHHVLSIDEISNFQVANRIEIFNAITKKSNSRPLLYPTGNTSDNFHIAHRACPV